MDKKKNNINRKKKTIIKSLALSKFVHLFISLPDPPKEVFKQLERMFYNFIWNNGPDRIKRKILTKKISSWGPDNGTIIFIY